MFKIKDMFSLKQVCVTVLLADEVKTSKQSYI